MDEKDVSHFLEVELLENEDVVHASILDHLRVVENDVRAVVLDLTKLLLGCLGSF